MFCMDQWPSNRSKSRVIFAYFRRSHHYSVRVQLALCTGVSISKSNGSNFFLHYHLPFLSAPLRRTHQRRLIRFPSLIPRASETRVLSPHRAPVLNLQPPRDEHRVSHCPSSLREAKCFRHAKGKSDELNDGIKNWRRCDFCAKTTTSAEDARAVRRKSQ